jgi:enoyl-[acyl-carrier protein] reductase II
MFSNRITRLFNIEYPIIQAGMVWASGWKLASAVSNAGGLGLIGSGSMDPPLLEEHIKKCRNATHKPFGVNLPLLNDDTEAKVEVILRNKVDIVFSSAGNPATFTPYLKKEKIKVVHVVSSSHFAQKAESVGCDAVVAEGFEAGGHNGREETTTLVLVPIVCKAVQIPVLAAGGIASGRQMLACMVLGAEGVQIGSRFVASVEASSHQNFKEAVIQAREGDTVLTLKELIPVRMMRNKFYKEIIQAYKNHVSISELMNLLGKGRARRGMFEGDMNEGELEIGEVSASIGEVLPAAEIIKTIWLEFNEFLRNPLK